MKMVRLQKNAGTFVRTRRMRLTSAVVAACVLAFVVSGAALAGLARQSTATRVAVTFSDSALGLSTVSLEAGKTTFVVLNRGRRRHAFEITGPGFTKGLRTATLGAGKSASLTVTLRPGAYMLSDPVGLSAYNVQYIDVAPAAVVTATGTSSVVAPPVSVPPMCGNTYTP
jgi:hypothetical protein